MARIQSKHSNPFHPHLLLRRKFPRKVSGTWSRDDMRSVGAVDALIARGHSNEDAVRKSSDAYVQTWTRHGTNRAEWIVATYYEDCVADGGGTSN
jgi:hypothetical protein